MIAYGDWKTKKISDRLLLILMIIGIICIWVFPEIPVLQRISGIFAISGPLLCLACIAPGSIGGGDIKLMATGGFVIGIRYVWQAFVVGIMMAGIVAIFLIIIKKADRKSEIALGPFLCSGLIYYILLA